MLCLRRKDEPPQAPVPRYRVVAPATPGAPPTPATSAGSSRLAEARRIARCFRHRRDLTYQDVRIVRADGSLVEYAGPMR